MSTDSWAYITMNVDVNDITKKMLWYKSGWSLSVCSMQSNNSFKKKQSLEKSNRSKTGYLLLQSSFIKNWKHLLKSLGLFLATSLPYISLALK